MTQGTLHRTSRVLWSGLILLAAMGCRASSPGCATLAPWAGNEAGQCPGQVGLIVVYDNNPYDPRLQPDWGFACWVQYGEAVVLFDTGADGGILLGNLTALGLDPQDIDVVVLSHAHLDHTGGLESLLATGVRPDVYLPVTFPTSYKNQLRQTVTVHEVREAEEILPGMYTTGKMGLNIPEQGLVLKSTQGLVVITGCAHPGIAEMVRQAIEVGGDDICLVTGGFHLAAESATQIRGICQTFRELGVVNVAPCHCSGDSAREIFAAEFGEHYLAAGVGWGVGMCP